MSLSIIALTLFVLDLTSASFFERPVIYSLLSLYAFNLFLPKNNFALSLIILLITLHQFIIFGYCGLPLLYLIPLTAIALKAKKLFLPNKLAPYLVLLLCLSLQGLLIEPRLLNLHPYYPYTIGIFIANIIVMIFFSLKYMSKIS